jgi:hypothetical protein
MVKRIEPTPPAGESLEDLTGEAERIDAEQTIQPGADVAVLDRAAPPTNTELLASALGAGRDVFCAYTGFESPKANLPDDKVRNLAEAWGKVLDARGINLLDHMGDYALEFAACAVTFKIGSAVAEGVRAEIAQREAANKKPPEVPAPDAHGFGPP